ncbi:MAG: IS3 family transposase, partial [Solobacterium sp.]|nr:IS3 family transposase [Solobacterium sp.]
QDPNEKARTVCENFLARNFTASRPLEKLVTDVSYLHSQEGRLYLSVIKDLYDNSIIAYQISRFNDLKLVMDTVTQVINENWDSTGFCVLHSDQGFQYTNSTYIRFLDKHGVTVSHSRKANCYDNACCENFFGHLKSECLELHDLPKTNEDLIRKVTEYITFYNSARPQRKLKGMTPIQFRQSYLSRSFL